ncbi:MAG: TlpA family protein disulfide reductase [Bacteroidales bacterium]|nr:TlpA family protein disulfide reductase [Bacteroidales bacterium]
MKKIVTILTMLIAFASCSKMDVTKVLSESYAKCQAIRDGEYTMEHTVKYMTGNDTSVSLYQTAFCKMPEDTLFGAKFLSKIIDDDTLLAVKVYDGDSLLNYWLKDSTCTRTAVNLWAETINRSKHNYKFYRPLFSKSSSPLKSILNDEEAEKTLLQDTLWNGKLCYQLLATYPEQEMDTFWKIQITKTEYRLLIEKESMIPVQYSEMMEILDQGIPCVQYNQYTLKDYRVDVGYEDKTFMAQADYAFCKMKDYKPMEEIPLLDSATIAPNWTCPTSEGKEVSLSDYQGKVVILDFFYEGCGPCMLAAPVLQQLYEKYRDQGLEVIGLNPYDTADEITELKEERGLNYTMVCCDRDLPTAYHVQGYPTMYILNRDGSIAFSHVGYGPSTDETLEEQIKALLE